jgi:hypothetical protein
VKFRRISSYSSHRRDTDTDGNGCHTQTRGTDSKHKQRERIILLVGAAGSPLSKSLLARSRQLDDHLVAIRDPLDVAVRPPAVLEFFEGGRPGNLRDVATLPRQEQHLGERPKLAFRAPQPGRVEDHPVDRELGQVAVVAGFLRQRNLSDLARVVLVAASLNLPAVEAPPLPEVALGALVADPFPSKDLVGWAASAAIPLQLEDLVGQCRRIGGTHPGRASPDLN